MSSKPMSDFTGRTFGTVTVTGTSMTARPGSWWRCKCSCGAVVEADSKDLLDGRRVCRDKSHNAPGMREYSSWANMMARCHNQNNPDWKHYGGRGIKICRRWEKFETFLADMGACPDRMVLGRINMNGHYEPGNCEWTTLSALTSRKRNSNGKKAVSVLLGDRCVTVAEAAKMLRVSRQTVHNRLTKGTLTSC